MRLRPPRPAPAARVEGTRPPGLLAEKIGGIAFLQLLHPALRVTAQSLALSTLRGLARLAFPGSHARQRSGSGRYFRQVHARLPLCAENLCHVAGCTADRWLLGPAPARAWDDLRLVGLKLIFLIVTRAVSLLGLSRREWWWKDAEILMLRHQLAVAERERPRAHSRLTWPDRAWLALLAGTVPAERLAAMRLIVTPGTPPATFWRILGEVP